MFYRISAVESVSGRLVASLDSGAFDMTPLQVILLLGVNSTTVLMIPSDFVTLSKTLSEYLHELAGEKTHSKT
jgi:hypothetical protein